ncbi:MAG: CRISPR-associated protein Cas4 [Moorellales bacterium]
MTGEEFEELRTNKVNYYVVCPRKLWLYAKGLRMEPTSERLALGRLLHQHAYSWRSRREAVIDGLIRVDVIEGQDKILEVKYSQKLAEAARLQLAYYLAYLKHLGAGVLAGELRFPRQKRTEEVALTPELERRVEEVLRQVRQVELSPEAPAADFTSVCRVCAYAELCWG